MEKPTVNNAELMEITFLQKHIQLEKCPGDILQIEKKYASKLISLGYARTTFEEDRNRPIPPPQEYSEVIFLRSHHRYAYSAGDIGQIHSEDVEEMVARQYVELIKNEN
jgi:hypothetical protein